MDVQAFLNELRSDPEYDGQIVHVRVETARPGCFGDAETDGETARLCERLSIARLYSHQAEAVRRAAEGTNVLVATPAASGKTLCYTLPILRRLMHEPGARALLLFPTKALCQDQFRNFSTLIPAAGVDCLAGVVDGETPASLRRKLRDGGRVIFSNPDMLHSAIMPEHARWAAFFSGLSVLVLD